MKNVVYWLLVILAIVTFSVFSVLIRNEVLNWPSWTIYVLGFVLVFVLTLLRGKKNNA